MNNTSLRVFVAIALIGSNINAAFSYEPPPRKRPTSMEQQAKEVVSHLVGVMDTSKQAQANPKAPNVRMTTCLVKVEYADAWKPLSKSVFLYQEQAMSQTPDKPYRQRFLRITPSSDYRNDFVESANFKPTNSQELIGLCNRPESSRLITLNQLGKTECSVFIRQEGETYIGQTQPGGCPTNFRGAVKITNRIILHKTGMDTSDRGLDAAGNVVWGAKEAPYQFRWIETEKKSDRPN